MYRGDVVSLVLIEQSWNFISKNLTLAPRSYDVVSVKHSPKPNDSC